MTCDVSEEQLWGWIDDEAPELAVHLAECPRCRKLADEIRAGMRAAAVGAKALGTPLPEKVGSYIIKNLLGEGGQGIVYEAEQQSPRRSVALKVLKGGRFVNQRDIRHFERESQALADLNHPGIATIYEAGRTEEGLHFFVMELVAGEPLDVYCRDRDLSLRDRLELFCEVCEAVEYAHEQGVIHRDLKPTNILVDADGSPKVLDFGLARITDADVTLTVWGIGTGPIMGTLRYMSPEQARGQTGQIDARSDVYALGVILYELLTDHPPYDIGSFMPEAVRTICEQPPQKPSSVTRALGGDVETIVLKALEKEPSRRYQSVEELGADVRRYLSNEPILAKRPSRLYVLRKRLAKHRLAVVSTAVTIVIAAAVLGGALVWKGYSLERQREHELAEGRKKLLVAQQGLERRVHAACVGPAHVLLTQYPELPEACLVWAQARFRVGRQIGDDYHIQYVVQTLRKELAGDPSQWWLRALLVEIHRSMGDFDLPEQLEAQGGDDVPDTADTWYVWSFATLDIDKALEYAQKALEQDPAHTLALRRLTGLCVQTRRFDRAIAAGRRAFGIESESGRSEAQDAELNRRNTLRWLLFEGRLLALQRRYEEALERYDKAVALAPTSHTPYCDRACVLLCLRDYANAIDDHSRAIELSSSHESRVWQYYRRATPLWMVGRLPEAAADYEGVRRLRGHVSYADARRLLVLHDQAHVLRRGGQTVEARKTFEDAADVLEEGLTNATRGSWVQSIFKCLAGQLAPGDLVDLAHTIIPNYEEYVCEAYYYAGEACLLKGEVDEARQWFQQCVNTDLVFDPDSKTLDPMNEYHLAQWRLKSLSSTSGQQPQ